MPNQFVHPNLLLDKIEANGLQERLVAHVDKNFGIVDAMISASLARPAGIVAENFPRLWGYQQNASMLTSGQLWMVALPLPESAVVANLTFISGATGITGPQNWWFALYDKNRNLLRQTADQTSTAWAGNTVKTLALASAYTVPGTDLFYAGIMVKCSGAINTMTARVDVASVAHGIAPIISGSADGSLTTTAPNPASAITAITASNPVPYCYAS